MLSPVPSVVCNQLGFGNAVRAYTFGFRSGSSSLPIWLDGVRCTTTDRQLFECIHNGFGNEDCTHSEDAGVACIGTGLQCEIYTYLQKTLY